jgi:hypothetical protein
MSANDVRITLTEHSFSAYSKASVREVWKALIVKKAVYNLLDAAS